MCWCIVVPSLVSINVTPVNSIGFPKTCFSMVDRAIPRKGCQIMHDNMLIGNVTSGTMSPMIKNGIGIGYIEKSHYKLDSKININIRGKLKKAKIIKPPFYRNGSLYN